MKIKLLLPFLFLSCFVNAQPGSLDLTFGTGGKVTTPIGSTNDVSKSVAIQSDGKIVLAGYSNNSSNSDFALVRYTTNGSLDNTFGSGGKVTTPIGSSYDEGYSVAIQSDGKIVVAGYSNNGANNDFALTRYNSDGSLDNTFDTDGKVTTPIGSSGDGAYSVAIQSDGKIVVAGYSNNGANSDFALARYNSDGSLDNTFDTDGKVTTPIGSFGDEGYSVAIQSDGKIVVAGYSNDGANSDFALVRYNSDGSLDNTFDTDGKVTTPVGSSFDYGHSVAIQTNGKIVVAGYSGNGTNCDFAVVRYNSNGSLDNTFGSGGKVTTNIGSFDDISYSVAIQSDGKIVVAGISNGSNSDFALVRYTTNGSLDNTFGSGGKVTTPIGSSYNEGYSVAIQSDGKIVVAGYSYNGPPNSDFAVVRYNDCSPIITFSQSPIICSGQSVTVGSSTYTVSGTYTKVLTASNGCDSTVTTNLTVNPTYQSNQNATICQGDSVMLQGNYQTVAGTYKDTLQTINSCDSIITTTLAVNPLPTATITASGIFCQGNNITLSSSLQSSYVWSTGGTTQSIVVTSGGNYSVTVTDANSCSNTFGSTVILNPLPTVSLTLNPDTVCINTGAYALTGGSPSGGIYSGAGVSAGNFSPSMAGNGFNNIIYTYTDGNNCTNSDTAQIYVDLCTGIKNILEDKSISIFPNPTNGIFIILSSDKIFSIEITNLISGKIYSSLLNSNKAEIDLSNQPQGIYFIKINSEKGTTAKKIIIQ